MRVLSAGVPGTERSSGWEQFLAPLGEVETVDVAALAEVDLSRVDLLVVDAPWTHDQPVGVTLEKLSCPTVLVGNFGAHLAGELHLKLGTWMGCMCLAQDAIVWDASHPVYGGLADAVVDSPAPAHFLSERARLLFPIPDTLGTLRVHPEPPEEAGQVITGLGLLDSPECEVIAGGINDKTSNHVAIARQGRFLHWGFPGSPEGWSPEGRALFASCVEHLSRFRDDPVRELRTTKPRGVLRFSLASPVWRGEGMPTELRAMMQRHFLDTTFAGVAPDEVVESATAALAWFDKYCGYLRNEGDGWYVDQEALDLGVPIDDPAFLDAVLAAQDALLWHRYTGRALDADSGEWLTGNRGHLYFTDSGGYRWVSTLEPPTPQPPATREVVPVPRLLAAAARYDDVTRCVFQLELPVGFHAYGPGAQDGVPIAVELTEGLELAEDLQLWPSTEHLTGSVQGAFVVRGCGEELVAGLRVQLCDELTCLAPVMHELRCPIVEGNP